MALEPKLLNRRREGAEHGKKKTAKEASEVVATQKKLFAAKKKLKANNVQLGIQGETSIAPGSTLPTAPPPTVTGFTNDAPPPARVT